MINLNIFYGIFAILIGNLGSDDFQIRETATNILSDAYFFTNFDYLLNPALESKDPEVQHRAKYIKGSLPLVHVRGGDQAYGQHAVTMKEADLKAKPTDTDYEKTRLYIDLLLKNNISKEDIRKHIFEIGKEYREVVPVTPDEIPPPQAHFRVLLPKEQL